MEYKGYTILEDYDRNPYSEFPEFMYYRTTEGIWHDYDFDDGDWVYCGNCKWADSIEEAKDEIDAL